MRFLILSDMNYGHSLSEIENHRHHLVSTIVADTSICFVVLLGCFWIVPEKQTQKISKHMKTEHFHMNVKQDGCCSCGCIKQNGCSCETKKKIENQIMSHHQQHVETLQHALCTYIEQFVCPIEYSHKSVYMVRGYKDVIDDYQGMVEQYMKKRYQNTFYYQYLHGILFLFLDHHPTAISRFWVSILLQKKACKCTQIPIVLFFHTNIQQSNGSTWPSHEQEAFYQTIYGCNILAIFMSSYVETNNTTIHTSTSLSTYPMYCIQRQQPIVCTIESKGGREYTMTTNSYMESYENMQ
jgi:hypothetical protein